MEIVQKIRKPWFFCITIFTSVLLCQGFAQEKSTLFLPPHMRGSNVSPFFEREETVGSPFLSRYWLQGVVELWNHKRLPEPGQTLLFSYDKVNNIIYILNKSDKITYYPGDSILGFNLMDNNANYEFEKIPWISDNFFLSPIIKSDSGYSLYKRLITRFTQADFSNEGYYTKGRRFDEYVDYYEYYIIYPGNTLFRKLYLKEKDVRRALRDETKLLDEFFKLHDNEITEQSLIGIVQYIDDKKYPEK
jgi:hypothetical protein